MHLLNHNFDLDDPELAALAWARIAEPGDLVAGTITAQLGVVEALRWLSRNPLAKDYTLFAGSGSDSTMQPESVGGSELLQALGSVRTPGSVRNTIETWRIRLAEFDPVAELQSTRQLGATLLTATSPGWPHQVADLGAAAPFALWVLGEPDLQSITSSSVALVGARAATSYGEQVATELAAGLADNSTAVISGGAYGVDAAAHRGALAGEGATIAFMAGGIDRLYPPGNHSLLKVISETKSCAVVAEQPPGSVPYRSRFLARNRLIAAISQATIVVEAAWRSGALSTARHAAELFRPVGAVPGPITSMASAGCHQLIRDGIAVCVTDAPEVLELSASFASLPLPASTGNALGNGQRALLDGLPPDNQHVYEALPVKGALEVNRLMRILGLPLAVVLSSLGVLETRGLVEQTGLKWRRTR